HRGGGDRELSARHRARRVLLLLARLGRASPQRVRGARVGVKDAGDPQQTAFLSDRHARACRGHPRLALWSDKTRKTWMAGTCPAMTTQCWDHTAVSAIASATAAQPTRPGSSQVMSRVGIAASIA